MNETKVWNDISNLMPIENINIYIIKDFSQIISNKLIDIKIQHYENS